MRDEPELATQARVSKMLGSGFAFSLVGMHGVGSLLALVIGLRARKISTESSGSLSGIWMAWWCIVVGGVGAAALLPYLVWRVIRAVSK